jgi:hypothetical protein
MSKITLKSCPEVRILMLKKYKSTIHIITGYSRLKVVV